MPTVSIQKCEEYNLNDIKERIKKGISRLGGIKKFAKKGSKVLIKPNLLTIAAPDEAVTTHPIIIEAIIQIFQEAECALSLGDSSGFGNMKTIYEKSGMTEVCKKYGVEILDFEERGDFKVKSGSHENHFEFYKKIKDFDLIIDAPKFKTHALTMFTGAVKNLFGCVPGLRKARYHLSHPNPEQFSALLLSIYNFIKPQLVIMDGIVGMEGNGPRGGKPRKVGLILVSDDALSLDVIASRIAGFKFEEVPYLKVAKKLKIPEADISKIIVDENVDELIIKDFEKPSSSMMIPEFISKPMRNTFSAKPVCVFVKCVSCGTCAAICPANAIQMKEVKGKRIPVFDYSKCIRCYCCSEMCPHESIHNEPTFMMKLFNKK